LVPIDLVRPSPENVTLYRPVDPGDPEIVKLAESIRIHGIREPLVLSDDRWLLSGHRRHAAARLAGLIAVPCRVDTRVSRSADRDAFLVALREHNRQREKSFDEKVREAVISTNPEVAYEALLEQRKEKSRIKVTTLELREINRRAEISGAKYPMLNAVIAVLNDLRKFLPLSLRKIHYELLNNPPLIHASKPDSRYRNDKKSYKELLDLTTRARLKGHIPMDWIDDETRPVDIWDVHRDVGSFIDEQIDNFLTGFRRDLLQSQPNHIEMAIEKNTAANIIRPVVSRFGMTMTVGRGYSSLPPRHRMHQRFIKSGKEKLVLLILSDFDPDGDEIAHSFARSMRDDFGITNIAPIKVALTHDQLESLHLPTSLDEPKPSSANTRRFRAKYGATQSVYELEAVPSDVLQRVAREAIDNVLDLNAFNRELAQEKIDAAKISGLRQVVLAELRKVQVR